MQLSYEISPAVGATATARYLGSQALPHYAGFSDEDRLEITPSFLTFDIALARARTFGAGAAPRLEVTAGVRNVTDRSQRNLDQGPKRDSGYVSGPRAPRAFYAAPRIEK